MVRKVAVMRGKNGQIANGKIAKEDEAAEGVARGVKDREEFFRKSEKRENRRTHWCARMWL